MTHLQVTTSPPSSPLPSSQSLTDLPTMGMSLAIVRRQLTELASFPGHPTANCENRQWEARWNHMINSKIEESLISSFQLLEFLMFVCESNLKLKLISVLTLTLHFANCLYFCEGFITRRANPSWSQRKESLHSPPNQNTEHT